MTMTEAAHPSPLTGLLGLMPTLAEIIAIPPAPDWAKWAVSFSDDGLIEKRTFFLTRVEARRWASFCNHPTTVVDLVAEADR